MNSAGVGSFFNLLNFGQMYSYHVLLLPAAVVALVVAHVLLVRQHGVVPPFELASADRASARRRASRRPDRGGRMSRRERRAEDERYREWKGGYRPYDLVKEASIALGVVLALARGPDDPVLLARRAGRARSSSWSRTDPVDFVTTAATELDGSSGTAGYGPPYNHDSDGQHIAFIHLQKWLGVEPPDQHRRRTSCSRRCARSPASRRCRPRSTTYESALRQAADGVDDRLRERARQGQGRRRTARSRSRPATTGRCPTMMAGLLTLRPDRRPRRRAADQQAVLPDRLHQAAAVHGRRRRARQPRRRPSTCSATQWGMMNETGSYPGPGLAVAVHVLVPDQAVLDLGQRRHPRDGRDGRAEPRARPDPVHPGRPRHPALDPDLQADLARALPVAGALARGVLRGRVFHWKHVELSRPPRALPAARVSPERRRR